MWVDPFNLGKKRREEKKRKHFVEKFLTKTSRKRYKQQSEPFVPLPRTPRGTTFPAHVNIQINALFSSELSGTAGQPSQSNRKRQQTVESKAANRRREKANKTSKGPKNEQKNRRTGRSAESLHLLGQLPRGGDADGPGKAAVCPLAEAPPPPSALRLHRISAALAVERLDDRDREGEGLAGAGAALAHQILAADHLRWMEKEKRTAEYEVLKFSCI